MRLPATTKGKLFTGMGLAASVVTVLSGLTTFWPGDKSSPDLGGDASARVQGCMAAHGLNRARDVFKRGTSSTIFASCTWPVASFADPDGYVGITVRTAKGPGQDNASGTPLADRIASPCLELEVAYSFGAQGDFDRQPPFYVQRGSVLTVDGEPWRGNQRLIPFYPDRDETIILHNFRERLDYARCISPA